MVIFKITTCVEIEWVLVISKFLENEEHRDLIHLKLTEISRAHYDFILISKVL